MHAAPHWSLLHAVPAVLLLALVIGTDETSAAFVARRIVSDTGDPIRWPSYLTEYDGQLFFRANNLTNGNNVELWAFDGTVARRAAEINPGPAGSDPSDLTVYNGRLYFCASGPGGTSKLWCYDAAAGASLAPGSASQAQLPQELVAYGGKLYFRAARFGAPGNIGIELWSFDGTNQAPLDLYAGSGSSYPQHFIVYNDLLYLNACGTPGQGTELWRYNGIGMPTEAARIWPDNGSSPEQLAVYAGALYFSAYDGVHGRELWRYDGSRATLAADIVPGGPSSSSNPSGLTVYNGELYFCATDEVHGYELWAFDGTHARRVAEINPTADPGNGDTFLMDSRPDNLTVFDGLLYFSADDGVHGRELWCYDGTAARLVLDINPGPYGSEVSELTVYNNALYFSADDGHVPGFSALEPQVFALASAPPTLEAALDAAGVVWTTGSHPWSAQTAVTHDGVDAAWSGPVHNSDDSSWLKITNIIGPGSVSFRWKAQIACGAFASFRVSGGAGIWPEALTLDATTDWRWETCFFGEGPQELIWVTYGNCNDPEQISLWLDEVVLAGPGREAAPVFTTTPSSVTLPAGAGQTFKAVAFGYPRPLLQWRFQNHDLPGATNEFLLVTNVQAADAGEYSVVAANALGTVTQAATLSVQESAPVIAEPPVDVAATFGLAAEFRVAARGTWPLSYQWRFNGVDLAGETNAVLSFNPVTVNQSGRYSVVIGNTIGSTVSTDASLSVVRVAAWGENAFGQSEVPADARDIVAVAAGSGHSLALRRNGSVLAWGDTTWNAPSAVPADLTNAIRIAAGGWHSLALRHDGTVAAWGFNSSGQTDVPAGLSHVIAIAGGLRHSLALKDDGRVVAWGYEPSAQPLVAAALEGVAAVAVGAGHNLALLSNGTIRAWGDNSGGPCAVPLDLSNVVAVAAGSGHSLALKSDGTLTAWGTNNFGQRTVPPEATNIIAIAAGDQHNLALRADGTLLAWGDNRYGQTVVPAGLTGAMAVAGGRAHTVALLGAPPAPSAPDLLPFQAPGDTQFCVSLRTVRGRTYYLEANDSPSDSDWVPLCVLFGDGGTRVFADPLVVAGQRFYRVRVQD